MPPVVVEEQILGERYALYGPIAAGGMATVHFGRLLAPGGFARTVAIKRLRGEFLATTEMVSSLLDEARLAGRVRHPNVVGTLDMVQAHGEVFLVMEYVPGESLARLLATARSAHERVPAPIAVAILCGVLHGLHAAHEATDEAGEPLGIVHRDVSPQNVLVGTDGLPRLLDFGVAKGKGRLQTTRAGQLKGKVSYMAPEQILGEQSDRRTDVYAASVVLWEVLTGQSLYPPGKTPADNVRLMPKILEADIDPPGGHVDGLPRGLDGVVMRGLNRDPAARYQSARALAVALEDCVIPATQRQLGDWVEELAAGELARRAAALREIEAAVPSAGRSVAAAAVAAAVGQQRREEHHGAASEARPGGGVVAPTMREPAAGGHRVPGPLSGLATDIDQHPPMSGIGQRSEPAPVAVTTGDTPVRTSSSRQLGAALPFEERTAVSPAAIAGQAGATDATAASGRSARVCVPSSRPAPRRPEHQDQQTRLGALTANSDSVEPARPASAAAPGEGRVAAPSSRPIPSLVPSSLGRDDIELPVGSRLGWLLLLLVVLAGALAAVLWR